MSLEPSSPPAATRWTDEERACEAAAEAERLARDGRRPPGELIVEGARLSTAATELAAAARRRQA